MDVYNFENIWDIIGNSFQSNCLYKYLKDLNAKTILEERGYIDKDYIITYSGFYARSFRDYGRNTKRLHFFEFSFSKEEFIEKFHLGDDFQKTLISSYLGFIVVTPVNTSDNKKSIGRTILKPKKMSDGFRLIAPNFKPSLYGLQFDIDSLPYHTHDNVVGACATTAIWIALQALSELFETQKQSSFEITNTSVSLGKERKFPSKGLDTFQIKNYFNSIGLETEYFNLQDFNFTTYPNFIPDVIMSYISYDLPIIAGIELIRNDGNTPDLHAVVICGYHIDDKNKIDQIYIHDDQIAPYTTVSSVKNHPYLSHWKNEIITPKTNKNGYGDIIIKELFVPLYPKIRMPFTEIYSKFLTYKNKESFKKLKDGTCRLYLTEVNDFKKSLLNSNFEYKSEILMQKMPKYLWIIEMCSDKKPKFNFVFDATSLHEDDTICEVFFND